ncbi:MAG: hypothetical protein KDA61_13975, partial [Planctomycetales bacterium]|nr:hypothetical protein [Planctomycetales bacterium]
MRRIAGLVAFAALLPCVVGSGASSLRAADYLVDPAYDGPEASARGRYAGVYRSLVAALSDESTIAVPEGMSPDSPNRIYIAPGVYNTAAETGRSLVNSRRNLALIGTTGDPDDVVITSTLFGPYEPSPGQPIGTFDSASLQLRGNNVTAAGITFANSSPTPWMVRLGRVIDPQGNFTQQPLTGQRQAVALRMTGDQQALVNSKILGYQDTLFVDGGRAYFEDVYVNGNVDFIFGQGTAVFVNSTINVEGSHSGGTIAAARTDKRTANGFVFIDATITSESVRGNQIIDPYNAASVQGAADDSMYLGRPWGAVQPQGDSATVWINARMSDAIRSTGWLAWTGPPATGGESARFAEFNTMDLDGNPLIVPGQRGGTREGNLAGRVAWGRELTDDQARWFTVDRIFAPEDEAQWFGQGFDGPADPLSVDYSWPAYWGDRSDENLAGSALVKGNPTGYTNPNWTIPGGWDPQAQIRTALVPEPGVGVLAIVAAAAATGGRARCGGGRLRRRASRHGAAP